MPAPRLRFRWIIVGLIFLAALMNNLDRQTLSVLAPTLRQELGITPVEYSYIVSSFLMAYTLGFVFAGPIIDRVGVKLSLALALGIWSVITGLHAVVTSWIGLVVCRFLLGLAQSFGPPASMRALADWVPSRERGLCVAIHNNGFVKGAILAPPLVSFLALSFGWQAGFLVTGALGFVLLAVWWRMYDPPESSPRLTPAEREEITRHRPATADAPAGAGSVWQLLRHPVCVAFIVSRFLTDPFAYFFSFWLPDYFQNARGFSLALMGLLGWLPYVAGDIGGPGGGALSDWMVRRGWSPRRSRLLLMGIAASLMPLANVAVRTDLTWLSMALIAVMFAGQTCWMANQLALLTESFPRPVVARALALSSVGGGIGGVVATLLTGRAVASYGYVPVFTAMSILHLTAFLLLARILRRVPGS